MPKLSKFRSSKCLIKKLRAEGKTFGEITQEVGFKIPRSTMSMWCSEVKLPEEYYIQLKKN